MEKKPYVQPETKVVEVDDVEIICTSGEGQPDPTGAGFQGLEEGEFTW